MADTYDQESLFNSLHLESQQNKSGQGPQSTIRESALDDLASAYLASHQEGPWGGSPYPNYNSSHLTCRFFFPASSLDNLQPLFTLWLFLCPISFLACLILFEVIEYYLVFWVLPQPHDPHFLGWHQMTCDSCSSYTFVKNTLQKETPWGFSCHKQNRGQGHSLFWEHLPGTWGPLLPPRGCESGSSYLRSQWWQEFFPFLPLPSFLTSFLSLLLMLSTSVSRPWCIWACLTWWGQDGFSLPKETGVITAVCRRMTVLPLLQTSRSTCLQLFAWETPYVWTEFIKQCV